MSGSVTENRRVLAIDGGGIKGVFAASLLAEIEEQCDCSLADHFDLIVGTSTGGIIALGLGLGLSAREIVEFYEEWGPSIFQGRSRWRLGGFFAAKYDREPLQKALREVFGERQLGESTTRLMVPSLNLETGAVHIFKTAHAARFVVDYRERVVDVALATAAAPTYFPTHRLQSGVPLIDGGMWANNPMGPAAVEAVGVLGWSKSNTRLLSIGCTESPSTFGDDSKRGRGALYWATRVTETFMTAQASASLGTALHLLGEDNVHRVSPVVGRGRYTLDDVTGIASLKALGVSTARIESPFISTRFLDHPRQAFTPYRKVGQ